MTTKSELFKNLSPKKRNINSKFMIRSRSNLEPILSKKQKLFGVYKPVKNFHRFGKGIINSGINPDAIYVRFYEREITQPYKNPKFIIEEKKNIPDYPSKWSLGYSCKCNKPYFIPKQQQFTIYNFSNKLSKENNVHSTDNIFNNNNINIENNNNFKNEKFPFLNMKKKIYQLSNSKNWIPRIYDNFSNSNKSNVEYNIITNIPKENYEKEHLPEMIKNKKRKGIAEYGDQLMPFYPKFREEYSKLLDDNKNIFRRFNGIFSSMYDSSAKNGNIYKPFKRGNSYEK
jgi:hypothetical protein